MRRVRVAVCGGALSVFLGTGCSFGDDLRDLNGTGDADAEVEVEVDAEVEDTEDADVPAPDTDAGVEDSSIVPGPREAEYRCGTTDAQVASGTILSTGGTTDRAWLRDAFFLTQNEGVGSAQAGRGWTLWSRTDLTQRAQGQNESVIAVAGERFLTQASETILRLRSASDGALVREIDTGRALALEGEVAGLASDGSYVWFMVQAEPAPEPDPEAEPTPEPKPTYRAVDDSGTTLLADIVGKALFATPDAVLVADETSGSIHSYALSGAAPVTLATEGEFRGFSGTDGSFLTTVPRATPTVLRLYSATGELLLRSSVCDAGIRVGNSFYCGTDELYRFDLTQGQAAREERVAGVAAPGEGQRTHDGYVTDGQLVQLGASAATTYPLRTKDQPVLDALGATWIGAGFIVDESDGDALEPERYGCGDLYDVARSDGDTLVLNTTQGGTFVIDIASSAARLVARSANDVAVSSDGKRLRIDGDLYDLTKPEIEGPKRLPEEPDAVAYPEATNVTYGAFSADLNAVLFTATGADGAAITDALDTESRVAVGAYPEEDFDAGFLESTLGPTSASVVAVYDTSAALIRDGAVVRTFRFESGQARGARFLDAERVYFPGTGEIVGTNGDYVALTCAPALPAIDALGSVHVTRETAAGVLFVSANASGDEPGRSPFPAHASMCVSGASPAPVLREIDGVYPFDLLGAQGLYAFSATGTVRLAPWLAAPVTP